MVSNDFKEEKDSLVNQMLDESVSGFGVFWVALSLATIFLVMIGVIA